MISLRFSKDIDNVPEVHFNGPLTMGAHRAETKMTIGEEGKFYSLVGTKGNNGGTLTAVSNTEIPDDAHPKAEFEFKHRDPDLPPIKVTTFLETRC